MVPDEPGPNYPLESSEEETELPTHRGESTVRTTKEPTHNHAAPMDPNAPVASENEDQISTDLRIIYSVLEGFDL